MMMMVKLLIVQCDRTHCYLQPSPLIILPQDPPISLFPHNNTFLTHRFINVYGNFRYGRVCVCSFTSKNKSLSVLSNWVRTDGPKRRSSLSLISRVLGTTLPSIKLSEYQVLVLQHNFQLPFSYYTTTTTYLSCLSLSRYFYFIQI